LFRVVFRETAWGTNANSRLRSSGRERSPWSPSRKSGRSAETMLGRRPGTGTLTMTEVVVSNIPDEGLMLSFQEDAAALDLTAPGARFIQPVTADVLLRKAGDAVSVTGRLALSVMFECVDCLREFLASFEIPVEAQYLPGSPSLVAGEHVMPVEEAENYYYRDDVIELDDLVREEVLLAIPYKPLCTPDCRGLCPQCGVDLNTETCQCAPPPDPRLAALRQFFKNP
jgi:uncharacterized protein